MVGQALMNERGRGRWIEQSPRYRTTSVNGGVELLPKAFPFNILPLNLGTLILGNFTPLTQFRFSIYLDF